MIRSGCYWFFHYSITVGDATCKYAVMLCSYYIALAVSPNIIAW